ncbi:13358_t:CDS:2 [Acaulospora colombiana]|uniref:13358_t:CDS:1 n=1 Tax=Acaulospora colombiana TaxID=27376 RepID=A0ACA9MST4_9GLOM|nr:13358_t:CDS:2 [Acaulospora colombiana]
MKFHALRQDLRAYAEEFGVRQYPDNKDILERLSKDSPVNERNARGVFEYLATLQSNFSNQEWMTLRLLKFIPAPNNSRPNEIIYVNPRKCFFTGHGMSYRDIFPCVNFGEKANKFLQNCGVREEPSPADLAEYLVESSEEYWEKTGEDMLLGMKKSFRNDDRNYKLARIMRRGSDNFPRETRSYILTFAKDILISDSPRYQMIFNPVLAPEEEPLENLYRELGCRGLSECVIEKPQQIGATKSTKNAKNLRQVIVERAKLFYDGIPESNIKRKIDWIERLSVKEVKSIEITYELVTTKQTKVETINSFIPSDSMILYVIPGEPDYLGIASNLVRQIYKNYSFRDISHLSMLLMAPLESLELYGYPVERILEKKKFENQKLVNKDQEGGEIIKMVDVTSLEFTKNLHDRLRSAVKSCCSNLESKIIVSKDAEDKETESNPCENLPDSYLTDIGFEGGIQVFVAEGVNPSEIIGTPILTRFASILKDLSEVFELPLKTIHIFHDPYTNLIAFNRKKALFFNFKFYNKTKGEDSFSDAFTSWYLTFCHELAHNISHSHNAEHENNLCSFAELYMPNFLRLMDEKKSICKC